MRTLIKNGTIVTAEAMTRADVLLQNGKIAAVGIKLPEAGCDVVDAAGLLVLPGAIDSHTHLAMPFGGTVSSDDYFSGTKSAACGGTTTVFDFITQDKGELMQDSFNRRNALCAPDAAVDYAFHIGVADISTPALLQSVKDAVRLGVTSFKVYMVYDFGLPDGDFYTLLQACNRYGAVVGVHAENRSVYEERLKKYLAEGKTEPWWHYKSKDEDIAGEAGVRAIAIARMAGAPLYIAHLSDKQGMEAVTRARSEGLPIFAETCPQYLHFTNEVYKRERGRDFVCSPPMKGKASRDALWAGLRRGDIATVATDHCPFTQAEKDWGVVTKDGKPGNFSTIPNGCAGIETMYPYMLSQANQGRITFMQAVQLCAANPAKLFGISHVKGGICPGLDADIVLYDKKRRVTVTNSAMHGNTDHTIWEGVDITGYPVATYSRGRLVMQDGKFLGGRGTGRLIRCKPVRFDTPVL